MLSKETLEKTICTFCGSNNIEIEVYYNPSNGNITQYGTQEDVRCLTCKRDDYTKDFLDDTYDVIELIADNGIELIKEFNFENLFNLYNQGEFKNIEELKKFTLDYVTYLEEAKEFPIEFNPLVWREKTNWS